MSKPNPASEEPLEELLAAAVKQGDIERARRLVEAGADVSGRDGSGFPIIGLIRNVDEEMLQLLIEAGADIDIRDRHGTTMLHIYAQFFYDCAEMLLRHGADPNARDIYGETSLFYACSPDVAELLLLNGADVDAQQHDGWTAFHTTIISRRYDIAEVLLRMGADVEVRDNAGDTPLIFAANMYDLSETDMVGLLIGYGADVNAPALDSGYRPIHCAAYHGSDNLVRRLAAAGADIRARTRDGQTALDIAASRGHTSTVQALRELGGQGPR